MMGSTFGTVLSTVSAYLEWICGYLEWIWNRVVNCICLSGVNPQPNPRINIEGEATSQSVPPSNDPLLNCDVFLNHRGIDTKDIFVEPLYGVLARNGFRPFMDRNSISRGSHIFSSIAEALNSAAVHVAIFSKRYAESEFCLNELCSMVLSEKKIIPVFYDIEPYELRYPYGTRAVFAEALTKHMKRGKHDDVKRWEGALLKVADILGFRLADSNGDADQLMKSIVAAVGSEIFVEPGRGKRRVGLEESARELVGKLNMNGAKVGIAGIFGMGGIGKTTLAMEVHSHYAMDQTFQRCSFLKDVRSRQTFDVQKELVYDLLKAELKSSEDYPHRFSQIQGLRALIVIDDIDSKNQFEALIPDLQRLDNGTRVIVTSRARDVLNRTMGPIKDYSVLHEVQVLNSIEARQLFNLHAFLSEFPSEGFQHFAGLVADSCKGHPLVLEVIGASLFDKKDPNDKILWLKAAQPKSLSSSEEIQKTLMLSYEVLRPGEKMMFLDVACLLIGKREEVAMEIWESCDSCRDGCTIPDVHPWTAFRKLMDKSLIKLDSDRRLTMHDVLRDMGRDVVVENASADNRKGSRSHLWASSDAAEVLEMNKGTDRVRGISRARHPAVDFTVPSYKAELFAKLKELHLLVLDGCHVEGDFSGWPKELRWLQWRSFPFSELPSDLKLPNIAVLDLTSSSRLTHVWSDGASNQALIPLRRLILKKCSALEKLPQNMGRRLPKLRSLDLHGCYKVERLPDTIGQMKDLEQLILSDCENLRSIPDSIGQLRKLRQLILTGCLNLQVLPDAIVNLTQLERLMLDGCRNLMRLPIEFAKLANLEELRIQSNTLQELPVSMGGLRNLKILDITAPVLEKLPEDFGQLSSLTELRLHGCKLLASLPITIGNFQRLNLLNLGVNSHLKSLPESIGTLTAITTLELLCNDLIKVLPESFGGMSSLVHLQMERCPKLHSVKALPKSLKHLNLANCPELGNLPSFGNLTSLVFLNLCNCKGLTQVQGLDCLKALEEVNLTGCTSLSPSTVPLQLNQAMRLCGLSGSTIAVGYDSDWSKRKPSLQLISYYNDTFEFVGDGLAHKILGQEYCNKVCMETTVSSEKECVAVIFCFVAHDQGWSDFVWDHGHYRSECYLDAQIFREDGVASQIRLATLKHADSRDQVYLCTLRRSHPFVRFLKHGDKITVSARSEFPGWKITLQKASICVVHGEGDDQVMAVNSELLDVDQSRQQRTKFTNLVLKDNQECPEGQIDGGRGPRSVLLDPGTLYVVPRYFDHSFKYTWSFPTPGQGTLTFTANAIGGAAVDNVEVAIFPSTDRTVPRYEILVATGWIWIRRRFGGDLIDCASVAGVGITDTWGRTPLWVSIDSNTRLIQVGRGEPGDDVLLTCEDSDFLFDVQRISFSTYATPVLYTDIQASALQQQHEEE